MDANLAREEAQKLVSQVDEMTRKYTKELVDVLWDFREKHHIPMDGFPTREEEQSLTYEDVASCVGIAGLEAHIEELANQIMRHAEK